MTRIENLTLRFTMEINDPGVLLQFHDARYPGEGAENGDVPLNEQAVRAAAHVLAGAFTKLKLETGIQLRSVDVVE
ncbi:hypothetical protein [Arthrobacter sp. A2-55]|uniref:hypothetical protein n=1 Tax=Arthrobacter sp. A2-55 TaxID=2897337 RepID=UPI0021CD239E|nr:hypothetical protein [Arthrobacter sp. A2-55]MCU6479970.1 hypothetical protein [Arthrobacter sp. A2-55]